VDFEKKEMKHKEEKENFEK